MPLRFYLALLLAVVNLSLMPTGNAEDDWRTRAEATDYRETPRYDETMAYCQRLAAASPFVHIEKMGRSPEGREIVALIVSLDRSFTPEAARATGKEIVLVNACIHPGECEGKDAGLALIRDLLVKEQYRANGILDRAILIFVPIHSVDGHERFSPYNRINQNGPAEMGWRTTAQNYNLNRDWLKADAPEMRAMLGLFHRWMPDLFIDLHNTDGADYQYDITYTLERHANEPASVLAWQKEAFDTRIFPALEKEGHKIAPYLVLRTPDKPKDGFDDAATMPRFSTGYGALWNRPALLIEIHMLKDYRTRVVACYDVLKAVLTEFKEHPGKLRAVTAQNDREMVTAGGKYDPARKVPVTFKLGPGSTPFEFLGVEYHQELSAVSGALWTRYEPSKPVTFTVPFYNDVQVAKEVNPPLGYVIPAAWTVAIERLRAHGLAMTVLDKPVTCEVETYRLTAPEWQPKSFENHHLLKDFKSEPLRRRETYPPGSVVVYLDQAGARVAMNLLEPDGPDSLLRWGYLDAIFEPKEYAEERVMEAMAREMMARDPKLAAEFQQKVATDAAFAGSAKQRLDWFYERTPFYDHRLDIYPFGRIFERLPQ